MLVLIPRDKILNKRRTLCQFKMLDLSVGEWGKIYAKIDKLGVFSLKLQKEKVDVSGEKRAQISIIVKKIHKQG